MFLAPANRTPDTGHRTPELPGARPGGRFLLPVSGFLVPVLWASIASASPTLQSDDDPYPGIHHEVWRDASVPQRIHLVRIDLSSSELTLFATAEDERGARPSAYADDVGAQVAINGDAFAVAGYVPRGLAVGGGEAWSMTADDGASGFLRFGRVAERTQAAIVEPEDVVAFGELPASTQGVVSGRPLLVRAGHATAQFDCGDALAIPCVRAPRTAVAVSADGNTMWLAVVDGWQAASLGMTCAELAAFLDARGVHDALALDGGGASALVLGTGVISSPSDGAERTVANHLAVRYGALTPGQLVGFIRERDVFDTTANLPGALATLDDGRTDTVGADGMFNFPGVSPRLACVTASLTGYRTETRCVQVVGGEVNYDSMALYPNSDFPDAGPGGPDATPIDGGGPLGDGGPIGDGGGAMVGDGGDPGPTGCCQAGGGSSGSALALLVALGLRRRRRPRDGQPASA